MNQLESDHPEIGQEIVAAITLPYPPFSGNHQYAKNTRTGAQFLKPEILAYRSHVRALLMRADLLDKKLTGPCIADWVINPPDNRKRDEDNLLKVVKDSLTHAGLWEDDSRQVLPETRLRWAEVRHGGEVTLILRTIDLAKSQIEIELDCMEAGL